ncbi:MAG: sigma-54-dependent transcriptional regulator [Thermoanaerobaculia bacterium]
MALLLLVEDEPLLRSTLRGRLVRAGHSVQEAGTLAEAEMRLRESRPQVVVLDVDGKGIELLSAQREQLAESVIIVITASVEDALTAMRLGAADFLPKPVDQDELLRLVDKATHRHRETLEAEVSRRAREKQSYVNVIAESAAMASLLEIAANVASRGSTTVLIHGETGTGKEFLARSIHSHSPRAGAPLEALHCAATPEHEVEGELFGHETDARSSRKGLFELADGGTVILDEIGRIPMTAQTKLLHFLQERSFQRLGGTREILVDVRVIATTNRALHQEVAKGRFRDDLFQRLSAVPIAIPPLRERREDILPLAFHFMNQFGVALGKHFTGMSPELREKLTAHPWTGNVRELRNLIERAVLLEDGDVLTSRFLPAFPREEPIVPLEEVEFLMVQRALRAARGNQSQAARLLQVSRDQLRYRVKRYRELGRLSLSSAAPSEVEGPG